MYEMLYMWNLCNTVHKLYLNVTKDKLEHSISDYR